MSFIRRRRRRHLLLFLLARFSAHLEDATAISDESTITSTLGAGRTFTKHVATDISPGGNVEEEAVLEDENDVVLILDVDNTLYSERLARSLYTVGIEEQLIDNCHKFFEEKLGLSGSRADEMHHSFGSTVDGLRHLYQVERGASKEETEQIMMDFYNFVWSHLDYTPLDLIMEHQSRSDNRDETGYSHDEDTATISRHLRDWLSNLSCPIYLASNSPSWHVWAVVRRLGLTHIPWAGILAPDVILPSMPTKSQPQLYFQQILNRHFDKQRIVLLDDSAHNIERVKSIGMHGIQIKHPGDQDKEDCRRCFLEQAISKALGHVDEHFVFSDVEYLKSKNVVDAQSIHAPTWNHLIQLLRQRLQSSSLDDFCIADVGAGRLSMLQLLLLGHQDKEALWQQDDDNTSSNAKDDSSKKKMIHYHAYESNRALYDACTTTLNELGFQPTDSINETSTHEFIHPEKAIMVHLHMYDFGDETPQQTAAPQLIMGCCFADLMEPHRLVALVKVFLSKWKAPKQQESYDNHPTLIYFPITFAGVTQFWPPQPHDYRKRIPSDTMAFGLYSNALTQRHGHCLDPHRLVQTISSFGGSLVESGPSCWIIDKNKNDYLFRCMLYFFGTVAGPELTRRRWNTPGWIRRGAREASQIVVSNQDFLFALGDDDKETKRRRMELCGQSTDSCERSIVEMEQIQFVGPRNVTTICAQFDHNDFGPDNVEIESLYSLISSGTELKIFRGEFNNDALDVNIQDMAEERMAYPLAYGYSLVGRVVRVGSNVDESILGKLVFGFFPHANRVVCDVSAVQIVPPGIDALDAIFMPSVETTLSIVHDANVCVGEEVGIFGQGLVGLLVTAILGNSGTTITTFDMMADRLAKSSLLGASQALLPTTNHSLLFDVCIEVSGNGRALQSAIDLSRSGGRIVVASWYGNAPLQLKLGIDFHRSHKTLVTSQVSTIPARLSATWTKERRFAKTWDLVRQLKPSRLLTKVTTLSEAQNAYEALDKGQEVAVAFRYQSLQ